MTAKEYLLRLRKLRKQVKNKMDQCKNIRENLTFLQGIDYSKDKVQTSAKDQLSEAMSKLIDLEKETIECIEKYNEMYDEGINRINSLSRREYVEILTMRYLEDDHEKRKFEHIACAINYSYVRTCHMHGEALQEFERKFLRN